MSDPCDYLVGWICATWTEYVAAQAALDKEHEQPEHLSPNDSNDYTLGIIAHYNVAIACSPYSEYKTTSAATVATNMLQSFPNIRMGLLVGIGGGVPSTQRDIRLGDIVVGIPRDGQGSVFQYDFDETVNTRAFRKTQFLSPLPFSLLKEVTSFRSEKEYKGYKIREVKDHILQKSPTLQKIYNKPDLDADLLLDPEVSPILTTANFYNRSKLRRVQNTPTVHYGVIASAKQPITDAALRDALAAHRNVLCFETEAADFQNPFPYLVIRGICDYSDSHRDTKWQGYAIVAAAAYVKVLLARIRSRSSRLEAWTRVIDILSGSAEKNDLIGRTYSKDEREMMLNWLTLFDYAHQQAKYLQERQPRTKLGFQKTSEYKQWLNGNYFKTLFCPGGPGLGKTILACSIINDLHLQFRHKKDIGIAYIYFSYRLKDKQEIYDLVASLLRQLSQERSPLPETVSVLYHKHKHGSTIPSLEEISKALHSVVALYQRVYIVVDALDECEKSGTRARFLSELFSLRDKNRVQIFVTSRYISEITEQFKSGPFLDVYAGTDMFEGDQFFKFRASTEEISSYLDSQLCKLPCSLIQNSEIRAQIKARIIESACSTIFLAQLQFNSLLDKFTLREIRAALNMLPTGPNLYHQTYTDTMKRIMSQTLAARELAKQVLSWLTFTKRPLTTLELRYALAVEVGQCKLDEENLPQIENMVSVCAGLVAIDQQREKIRLAHYTTQHYFKGEANQWFPDADFDMMRICVAYLSFSVFQCGPCQTNEAFANRLRSNPLYDYAANNWGHHARNASTLSPEVIQFLHSEMAVEASVQALMGFDQYSPHTPRQMTGLHLAAYFGISLAVDELVRQGHKPSVKDKCNRTPLTYAAEKGHDAVVNLLLRIDAADINSKDEDGATPLSRAAANGQEACVKLLLDRHADSNSKDKNGETPLHWAAKIGHEIIVRHLLQNGANIDSIDNRGSTSLHESIRNAQRAVQELLIESGANLDVTDDCGQSPFELAWSKKRLDLFAYEVDNEATINQGAQANCAVLRNYYGRETPRFIFRKTFTWSKSAAGNKIRRYFLREHRIFQKLNHPFIVSYLGYEENIRLQKASLYMEFCEGGDLETKHVYRPDSDDDSDSTSQLDLSHPVPLREEEVWVIAFHLAAAMAYLHHGLTISEPGTFSFARHWEPVIHRDIKPANVVLKPVVDKIPIAKLCDLGLAKAIVGEEKQTRKVGTPDYSPPEVRLGKGWTIKGDIYSFGATMDDLYKESEPQPELRALLDSCKSPDKSARPSSLSILEIAREHVSKHEKEMCFYLNQLFKSGSGGYLLQSLVEIASGLDEIAAFGDEVRLRRKRILERLRLLCDDGAGEVFDKHSKSLHLSVLLNHLDKLRELLATGKDIDVDEKWQNSGWTPLHLAFQEDKQDVVALLIEYGADSDINDKYNRRPDYYKE
ncbi:Pfs, NACHT and Ankyrin domain protein [Metarhizium anisopliae]